MKHVTCSNIVLVVVVVVVVVITSCRPDTTCRENMAADLVCEFSEAYLDETDQVRYRTLWDSISVVGWHKTDSLYANSKNVSKIKLPLRHDQDSTTFVLTYHNLMDTMTIHHTPMQQFVSVECGCTYHHDILSVQHTQHWIDSVAVLETTVTRTSTTHLTLMHDAR